jgi:mannose-6-phosphate isomerase-like protein (cupin superfamily)
VTWSGGELRLAEWTAAPDGADPPLYIAPLHVHREDDEAWYVLEGELGVRVGDADVRVAAGEAVVVPRGTPHTHWNARAEPTRYLLVMSARIERLIAALHSRGDTPVEDVFRAHASEFLGWP